MSDDKLFVTDGLLPIPFEDIRFLINYDISYQADRSDEFYLVYGVVMTWLDAWRKAEKEGCLPAIMLPPRVRESFSVDYQDEL